MKIIRIISAALLLVCVFISVDLGINFMGALVPELQDGIPFNSVLQRTFGLLENLLKTREDFFNAFKLSLWVTFAVFAENVLLSIVRIGVGEKRKINKI